LLGSRGLAWIGAVACFADFAAACFWPADELIE
jgi:hypothetical protein